MTQMFDLQLFGEGGGAPAAGSAAGGEAAPAAGAPSEARLRELGVPEERLKKRADRAAKNRKKETEKKMSAEMPTAPGAVVQKVIPKADTSAEDSTKPKIGGKAYDIRSHYDSMHRQAAQMQRKYPEFDLQKELDDPKFLRLTGPEIGLELEDAYMALHHRELTRAIAERSRLELSNSIRAGGNRPAEHGMGAKAPAVVTFDYKNATKSQRAAFKKQIYDAAARGEKIYPSR